MDLNNLLYFYKGKKVLVTGHTGFKGSWLCEILLMAGAEVYGYSLRPEEQSMFNLCKLEDNVHSRFADIRDFTELKAFFDFVKPDIVFHLAAQPIVLEGYKNPVETYGVNVMGTVNILDCLRLYSLPCSFVNITTDKVYLNREWEWGYREYERLDGYDPYSNSKSCSELVTATYKRSFFTSDSKIAISTARAGNVIGGGDFAKDRIVPDCVRAAETKQPLIVRNPSSTRPYQHVLEPLFAYLLLAYKQSCNMNLAGSFNVGPGDEGCFSTLQIVETFKKYWGETFTWETLKTNSGAPHEANFLRLDNTKIKSEIGWRPVWSLKETISSIVQWHKAPVNDRQDITQQQINAFIKASQI
ncbi:MAG: CDP-glucose 4,6-dehydratase [Muribaculaceae bacterium]|nr:CDP-glucose 4,6-dehydratase [Muribaculaceae bacterium]